MNGANPLATPPLRLSADLALRPPAEVLNLARRWEEEAALHGDDRLAFAAEAARAAAEAQREAAKQAGRVEHEVLVLPALDLRELARCEPQPPRFIIADWLPAGYATLLAGHGGAGKSQIALTLAVCLAAGHPFCGLPVERRKVTYLSCEDRADVLHWRLARICRHLGLDLASLTGWLHVHDMVGRPAVLWERNGFAAGTTGTYEAMRATLEAEAAEVLIVDGVADVFGGNELAKGDIKQFLNAVLALVPPDGAVLLLWHVNKATASNGGATGEGYSGSAQWHNAARARWYLRPEVQGEERTGAMLLELQKSNFGETDRRMRFTWSEQAGLLVGQAADLSTFDRRQQERAEREGILNALRACPADSVPAAVTGNRTAYHVLSARPEFPQSLLGGKAETRRFNRHLEALRAMGCIEERSIRRADRHYVRVLTATDKECGHAGNV